MSSINRTKELVGDPTLTDVKTEYLHDAFRALVEISLEPWQHCSVLQPLIRGDPY